jgi:hypothetical protein
MNCLQLARQEERGPILRRDKFRTRLPPIGVSAQALT